MVGATGHLPCDFICKIQGTELHILLSMWRWVGKTSQAERGSAPIQCLLLLILWLTQHTSPRLLITAPGGWGWGLEKGEKHQGIMVAAACPQTAIPRLCAPLSS